MLTWSCSHSNLEHIDLYITSSCAHSSQWLGYCSQRMFTWDFHYRNQVSLLIYVTCFFRTQRLCTTHLTLYNLTYYNNMAILHPLNCWAYTYINIYILYIGICYETINVPSGTQWLWSAPEDYVNTGLFPRLGTWCQDHNSLGTSCLT